MKYLVKQKILPLLFISLAALISTSAFAAAGGNGNANSNANAGLQAQVQANADDIAALGVNTSAVDCAADDNALQDAIDATPAAGAILNVSGNCSDINVIGRTNLLIDGGGSASTGDVFVDAARNIQIRDIAMSTLTAENTSSVFVDGSVSTTGNIGVNRGSTVLQLGGSLNASGEVTSFQSGNFNMSNGSVGGVTLSRSSSAILNTGDSPSNTITVNGDLGSFSGSNLLLQAFSPGGAVTVNAGTVWTQRVAASLFAGDNLIINSGFTTVRQNGVLDVINMVQANFNPGNMQMILGSGSRVVFSDGPFGPVTPVISASCDDSSWADTHVECAP